MKNILTLQIITLKQNIRMIIKRKRNGLIFFRNIGTIGKLYVDRRISKAEKKKLDVMLRDAGYQYKWTAIEFRLMQLLLTFGSGLIVFLLFLPTAENKALAWVLVFTISLLIYRLPLFYLSKKRTKRILIINKSMADFFDMVNVLLEAGMGLDAATC